MHGLQAKLLCAALLCQRADTSGHMVKVTQAGFGVELLSVGALFVCNLAQTTKSGPTRHPAPKVTRWYLLIALRPLKPMNLNGSRKGIGGRSAKGTARRAMGDIGGLNMSRTPARFFTRNSHPGLPCEGRSERG